jgi:RecA/RadA recombinase
MSEESVAESINIEKLISSSIKKVEKSTKLNQVYLHRENFAANAIPTGSLQLDMAIGGGVPPGRIVGISGEEPDSPRLLLPRMLLTVQDRSPEDIPMVKLLMPAIPLP